MKAPSLAHAYVVLDRLVLQQLCGLPELEEIFESVIKRIRVGGASASFQILCETGHQGAKAESAEVLWILAGCRGLPGFADSKEAFGLTANDLKNALSTVELAASAVQKISHKPFGILAQQAFPSCIFFPESLRLYVALARSAQQDFGHGADWFLNIAKARLVIHVTSRMQSPHDREVSGLIAAMTGKTYSAEDQSSWRQKHKDLIRDAMLDPHTTQTAAQRDETMRLLREQVQQDPDFQTTLAALAFDFVKLIRFRNPQIT